MNEQRMPVAAVLTHLCEQRRENDIVITNQASARLWPTISNHPLDFNYNPSTMGGAIPFAVGLALAKPKHEVIVISGDGSLLMSLGCLVTAVASGVANLTILLLDNGMYEVTGGQKTAASEIDVDYVAMARAAGFRQLADFDVLDEWQAACAQVFESTGPRFVRLAVGATPTEVFAGTVSPIDQRLRAFRQSLVSRP